MLKEIPAQAYPGPLNPTSPMFTLLVCRYRVHHFAFERRHDISGEPLQLLQEHVLGHSSAGRPHVDLFKTRVSLLLANMRYLLDS